MAKKKMTKDIVPEGFTMGMALMDALPVIFFGVGSLAMGRLAESGMILAGGLLCFLAGLLKVLWKVIVVVAKRNVWPLFVQMRWGMPVGFVLMILGCFLGNRENLGKGLNNPVSLVFLAVCVLGIAAMVFCGIKLDSSDARANWIEQGCNAIAQGAFMLAMIAAMQSFL